MAEKLATAKPRRRWYQFSLRTLLIGMALLAIPGGCIAHEARFVAERKAWLAAHSGACVFATASGWPSSCHPEKDPSFIRRCLGDRAVAWILSDEARGPLESLFPEARIIGSSFNYLPPRLYRQPSATVD
jgi:hypothetical protein